MVSRMDSICERYAAGCTKTEPKILQVKRGQKQRNAPGKARKRRNWVRFGCWRGWERLWAGANGWESLAIGQKDLSRLPARAVRGTRFWSGCGRTQAREGRGRCCPFSSARRKRAVLVWCCELFLEKDCVSTTTSSFERKAPPPEGWPS